MDIDRFIATHHAEWDRLDALVRTGRRSVARLSAAELDELLTLYRTTSAHLSVVRTQFNDVALSNRLSRSLGNARGLIYRSRGSAGSTLVRFFTETFPAAAYSCRRAIAIAALLLLLPAAGFGLWLYNSGEVRNAAIDPATQELVAESKFADYYRSEPAAGWAFQLFTHNIEVAVLSFAGGALGAVWGVTLLVENGASLGASGAVMHAYGRGAQFWGLIAPHGLLELTAVLVASGAGLSIAWAMFAPGDRTRGQALADDGLRAAAILLGSMVMFVFAGFTEAFITPSGLPTWSRVAIGIGLEALALSWMFGRGRSVCAAGLTGRLGEPALAELDRAAERTDERTGRSSDRGAPRAGAAQSRPEDFTFR